MPFGTRFIAGTLATIKDENSFINHIDIDNWTFRVVRQTCEGISN
ncbi:MAG: hypothetical protein ACJAUD_002318 [Crocinitomicaceae bacterium]|jgi:hypothetical protein